MNDVVELVAKRNRGWPQPELPEDGWGMPSMFGEDGWCRECGTPLRPQCGPLTLQRRGLTVTGAWVPYSQWDAICMEQSLADEVASRFDVDLRPVAWPRTPPGAASQIVVPTVGDAWFDHDELRTPLIAEHGTAGSTCDECGIWRWMPLGFAPIPPMYALTLPPLRITPPLGDVAIAASPEWFGSEMNAFRQILVRRELAEMLAAASPRDFKVRDVSWA